MALGDLILPAGYAQTTWSMTQTGLSHVAQFTLGVKLTTTTWTAAEGAVFYTNVTNALKPLWDNTVTFNGFHALIGSSGPPAALDVTGSVTGTGTFSAYAPPNVTYLFKKTTLFAGRKYRGRLYLPFVQESFVNNAGDITAPLLAVVDAAAAALAAVASPSLVDGVDELVLVHRATTLTDSTVPTPLANITAEHRVATQRRRLDR